MIQATDQHISDSTDSFKESEQTAQTDRSEAYFEALRRTQSLMDWAKVVPRDAWLPGALNKLINADSDGPEEAKWSTAAAAALITLEINAQKSGHLAPFEDKYLSETPTNAAMAVDQARRTCMRSCNASDALDDGRINDLPDEIMEQISKANAAASAAVDAANASVINFPSNSFQDVQAKLEYLVEWLDADGDHLVTRLAATTLADIKILNAQSRGGLHDETNTLSNPA